MDEKPDDVVGHKTFRDGKGGFRHEPLARAEGDALRKRVDETYQARREKYPDEQTCIDAIFDACVRLEEMGWKRAYLAPPDRKIRKTISLGSTGIHDAYCEQRSQHPITLGNWWWHPAEGDLWPHEPIYFKPSKEPHDSGGGKVNFTYTKPAECSSFWTWLWAEWDIRKRWEGPSRLIREVGLRVLGIEITWERVHHG